MSADANKERLAIDMRVVDKDDRGHGIVTRIECGQFENQVTVLKDDLTLVTDRSFRFDEKVAGVLRLSECEPFQRGTKYRVDASIGKLKRTLDGIAEGMGLDLDPDFQRGHVWTSEQQTAFMEYRLRGGIYGQDLWFNCIGWERTKNAQPIQIVDGLQRLTAAYRFMQDEVVAFGQRYSEFHEGDRLTILRQADMGFHININNLPNRKAVLKWYIDLNSGGTPHAPAEIARVTALLDQEANET